MRHRTLTAALAACLCLFAAVPAHAEDRALVIGVNHFPGIAGGENDLVGSVPDAQHFAQLLVGTLGYQPSQVKVLTDADATRQGILDAFQHWLVDGSKPGDRVTFFFSGHGSRVLVPDGHGGKRVTSAIVPSDTGVNPALDEAHQLILGTQMHKLLDKLAGRHVMIVADSCFSGSISKDGAPAAPLAHIKTITPHAPLNVALEDVSEDILAESSTETRAVDFFAKSDGQGGDLQVWSAATTEQFAFDGPNGGVFTSAFIDGLAGRKAAPAGASTITAGNLLNYVQSVSKAFCEQAKDCSKGLTPELAPGDQALADVLVPYAPVPVTVLPPTPQPTAPQIITLADGVLNHLNDFALTAEILPGAAVKLGSTVRFRIASGERGQLVVLDTSPDGKLRRIFPNDVSADPNPDVDAGKPLTIPAALDTYQFTATDAGPGRLMVLVAEDGADLSALTSGKAFEEMNGDATRALVAVANELSTPVISPDPNTPNRTHRWSFVSVPYTVAP